MLVFGSQGQVGSALIASVPAGVECVAATRADCDLSDIGALGRFLADTKPDIVINAAAYTAVDRAEIEPDLAQQVNCLAVAALYKTVAQTNARLIHLSTDFVFNGRSYRAYRPDDPVEPLSIYGKSKAQGELTLGRDATVVRTSWVYASGSGNFVTTILRLMRERETLEVVADQIGAPTWAPSLAQTLWALAQIDCSGLFHFSDAGVASWYDFAVAIGEEACELGLLKAMPVILPIATAQYPTAAKRPAFSVLDSTKTHIKTGLAPSHWRKNLRKMLKQEMTE